MADTELSTISSTSLPVVSADPAEVARITDGIDLGDRSSVAVFGDRAQQSVSDYADRILREVRNKDVGEVGRLLNDIILKSRNLDPASIKEGGFFSRMFKSAEARLQRFREEFEDVAGQIDRIGLELDRHKDTLRRDIALLDNLHDETKQSIVKLEAYIDAGKTFAEKFRAEELPRLKNKADAAGGNAGDGLIEAQAYQDALQALDRLEKRIFYLQQARQLGIQQLPQIRIVQSGDETLIENLQATSALTVPAWKQKMVILLGLNRQKSALELQKTVTDATNDMIRQASQMMKDQAIAIEEQSQRGIVDIDTLEQANRDLIDTISGVLKVQEDGRLKRAEAETRMEQLTVDLKKAMTSV